MKEYTIRREVLNISFKQWQKLGNEDMVGTSEDIYKEYGLISILGVKANEDEKDCITEIYNLHRERNA